MPENNLAAKSRSRRSGLIVVSRQSLKVDERLDDEKVIKSVAEVKGEK